MFKNVRALFDAATIFSLSVSTQVELELMKTANAEREQRGESLAYNDEDFHRLYMMHNESIREIVKES